MSSDFSLKIPGVEGESTHEGHKGEIDVLGFSWGATNASMTAGGGSGKGKASPGELNIQYRYCKASPVLAKKLITGTHLESAVLTACKSGEGQKPYLTVTLKEVFVTSISHSASSEGDIHENASLSYGDVEYVYKPQDEKGGLGGPVSFGWNVKTTATR
jgi:type VI secretion system secreted protein Hcp